MNLLFDTSVLVAAMVTSHPEHSSSLSWLQRAHHGEIGFYVSAHSLIEVYSVLTRAPFQPRIPSHSAWKMIRENIRRHAKIIVLSEDSYYALIEDMSASGIVGGAAYDAIIFRCAQKARVDHIFTLNPDDFLRFTRDAPEIVLIP